jgi:hypothetical protein
VKGCILNGVVKKQVAIMVMAIAIMDIHILISSNFNEAGF